MRIQTTSKPPCSFECGLFKLLRANRFLNTTVLIHEWAEEDESWKERENQQKKKECCWWCFFSFDRALNAIETLEHNKTLTPPSLALSFMHLNLTRAGSIAWLPSRPLKKRPLKSQIIAKICKNSFAYWRFYVAVGIQSMIFYISNHPLSLFARFFYNFKTQPVSSSKLEPCLEFIFAPFRNVLLSAQLLVYMSCVKKRLSMNFVTTPRAHTAVSSIQESWTNGNVWMLGKTANCITLNL